MTDRIEALLRTMTERTGVVKDLIDGENFSWAWNDLDTLLDLSDELYEEIKYRRTQVYKLMYDEIKEP